MLSFDLSAWYSSSWKGKTCIDYQPALLIRIQYPFLSAMETYSEFSKQDKS